MNKALLLLLPLSLAFGNAVATGAPQSAPADAHAHHAPASATQAGHAMGSDAADDAFAKLDTDKNGVLSKAELAKHPMAAHAAMVDANRDGSLDRKEFEALQRM